tara:strand:- start:38763 stop:39347 length:585 start_codon:yes stop_codon:yes gene_type:complete
MDNSNKQEFAKVFYAMGEFYDKKVSTELLGMYFDDLIEFSIEQVRFGAKSHRQDPKHGTFFPKPADIIRHLETGKLSPEEQAEIAWAEIMQCLRRNGAYGGLKIENKQAIAAFKAFTTWKEFCAMDASKLVWAKKEFMSMYSTYDKTPLEMLPSSLPGLVDLHNHKDKHAALGVQSAGDIMAKLKAKRLDNNQQ